MEDLATRFFTASSSGDIDGLAACCSPDVQASQNGGPAMPLKGLMAFVGAVLEAAPDFRYENRLVRATSDGFVEEHDVVGNTILGESFNIRVCVVCTAASGKITSMREYFDPAGASALTAAFAERAKRKSS